MRELLKTVVPATCSDVAWRCAVCSPRPKLSGGRLQPHPNEQSPPTFFALNKEQTFRFGGLLGPTDHRPTLNLDLEPYKARHHQPCSYVTSCSDLLQGQHKQVAPAEVPGGPGSRAEVATLVRSAALCLSPCLLPAHGLQVGISKLHYLAASRSPAGLYMTGSPCRARQTFHLAAE